ncbi:error-prone DNA polymerase [Rhodoferax mekongensis]|uniref:Error-prone DNA polymerase n=1 Tax=Rhodoferax mekongensis TaxID=3068341 RepID=A0ABZ0B2G8_9BURK|nr:error-prone DNA polymerase [Rhodoferax sp. TBRC 17307]WNO06118.1 error-prone DNA polymerase [Rhodoferax sp. TBRC 17307]
MQAPKPIKPQPPVATTPPAYAELHCLSNFSFQRGASQPEELVERAHRLGYAALAITDECSVAGVVRAHGEAQRLGLQLLPGAEFAVPYPAAQGGVAVGASFTVVVLPHNLQGWGNLCEFITRARMAAPKGDYRVAWLGQPDASPWHTLRHCEVLLHLPLAIKTEAACAIAMSARGLFGINSWLSVTAGLGGMQAWERAHWQQIAAVSGLAPLATGQVRMHTRSRKPLHDVLTAVRCGLPVVQCGFALQANAEHHLRSRARLAALFTPDELAHTLVVAGRCSFTLDALRYQYPMEAVLPGHTPAQTLRQYTEAGALERYPPATHPHGMPPNVRTQVEHELALIADMQYEMYFLTVHDLVRFARGRGILCQGRGSAANSAVCYCLGVTEVDPSRMNVLFERFISKERDEPPDIDVDFEHQRREEVIQYIYAKYGRERAAITAVVASYRPRSALRDVGRALEIPEVLITAMAKEHPGMYSRAVLVERLQDAIEKVAGCADSAGARGGFDAQSPACSVGAGSQSGRAPSSVSPARVAGSSLTYAERPAALAPSGGVAERGGSFGTGSQASAPRGLLVDGSPLPPLRRLQLWLDLATQLQRFPRHLSQHVGGFVLTQGPLTRLVPVENASMPDRSVIQWDKDDLDAVGLLKVDVLALGMLSAIRRCLHLIGQWRGTPMRMQDVPAEDPATYAMICQADTVGVFQIESRAQMSMLPRLKPQCFYDLVVEVAIVRPGPIQGGMVHPYLKARANPQAVTYASPGLEEALKRTLGVPIFQEQVMQIAMAAADFTAGEADQLRRSMAAWKRKGGVGKFYERLVGGMLKNGYTQDFADTLFKQIEGFGEYGFPESHAASFALLVYVSCWLKRHEPACFLAAMLNSQPLGFYGPAQLVQDARRHGVEVRAVDVLHSAWDCTLEQPQAQRPTANGWALQTQPAIRLGLRMVSGLQREVAERICAERKNGLFNSTQDLALRCALDAGDLKALASADALISLSGHRRQQVWDASALRPAPALLQGVPIEEEVLALPPADEGEEVTFDYAATGLTLRSHPLLLLREQLSKQKLLTAAQMRDYPSGRLVRACGIVTARQQPGTAKGVVFVTLEDETGSVNIIVWKAVKEQFRDAVYRARLMAVYGVWQRDEATGGQVRHVIAKRVVDMTHLLGELATTSRDFH